MTTMIVETAVLGRRLRYRALDVRTPDGLKVAAQDWGGERAAGEITTESLAREPRRRDVLLVHGIGQSHLCWLKQVTSPLATRCRFVTYDLRGHGGSDKPLTPDYYRDSQRWAQEVQAVIAAAGLVRPVIVAWSYGGRVTLDYLRHRGEGDVSGVVFAGATSNSDPAVFGPAAPLLWKMADANGVEEERAAIDKFLRSCTAQPIPTAEYELMLEYNLLVPPSVIRGMVGRPAPYAHVLGALSVPVLAIHGEQDPINLPAMAEYTAQACLNGKALIYEGVGHSPFWEAPERFNADLEAFVAGLPRNG